MPSYPVYQPNMLPQGIPSYQPYLRMPQLTTAPPLSFPPIEEVLAQFQSPQFQNALLRQSQSQRGRGRGHRRRGQSLPRIRPSRAPPTRVLLNPTAPEFDPGQPSQDQSSEASAPFTEASAETTQASTRITEESTEVPGEVSEEPAEQSHHSDTESDSDANHEMVANWIQTVNE
ncbi:hypothetical protein K449DRAFT_431098 [Hypoxylon sp. EC38]|nr:hypothetical protein K449DRAFT_431098 [Hypoxylon sp. EC38]